MKKAQLIAAACAAATLAASGATPAAATGKTTKEDEREAYIKQTFERYGNVSKTVGEILGSHHITRKAPDDTTSQRAWTNALERCDPQHMIFLERDIEALAQYADKLDDMANDGKIPFPFLVRRVYGARLVERINFATNYLANISLGLSGHSEYGASRSREKWLPPGPERNKLWAARVESVVADELLDAGAGPDPSPAEIAKAAKKAAKRYLAFFKKQSGKSYDEVCTDYIADFAATYDAHTKYLDSSFFKKLENEMLRGPKAAIEDDMDKKPSAKRAFSKVLDIGGKKFAYLRLSAFYGADKRTDGTIGRSSADDLERELDAVNRAGAQGLLFDLRGNGGGGLDDAVKTIALFVRSGPAVRMIGVGGDVTIPVAEDAIHWDKPVVVLVDRGSASAGELVPATLQDTARAVIVGDEHTFGKGTAQTIVPIDGGKNGALAVTEGRFYRITGASTQFKGVEPDIVLRSIERNYAFAGERGLPYAMEWDERTPVQFDKSWNVDKYIPQLAKASEKRRKASKAWKKYSDMAERAEKYFRSRAMPLDLAARKAVRDDRKRIEKTLDKLEDMRTSPDKVTFGDGADPVRDEAFRILRDLVKLNGNETLPPAKPSNYVQPGVSSALDDF